MKFILTKKQFEFLTALDNVNDYILDKSFENDNVVLL